MNAMSDSFKDNTAKARFEYHVGDQMVFADYRIDGDKLYINYVEAAPSLRGTGAAGKLMRHIVDSTPKNITIIPICGYAAAWMRKNRF